MKNAKDGVAKVFAALGHNKPLNSDEVREALVVIMQVFCGLLSQYHRHYRDFILRKAALHATYLAKEGPPTDRERLLSPEDVLLMVLAASGWPSGVESDPNYYWLTKYKEPAR